MHILDIDNMDSSISIEHSGGVLLQPVIITRIYVLHKITIALKLMSYINSREKTANPRLAAVYKVGSTAWKRVASNVAKVINSSQIKST